ncbi:homeobox protein cut-like 1 [Saccoglossus kowalevskii]
MAAANLLSMNQYWKTFDLPQLQRELDSTATDLANRQDEGDSSRKRLIDQSREFKKNTPEDIRKSVAPLLKSFQLEVDALSKRSKAAEAAFLSVYKKLIDVPDPVPVLEHAMQLQKKMQRAQDLEIENQKLRETLNEYNNEFAEVKNQEVTIKTLKEKLKEYEDKMEAVAQARAKEKEKELQREFAEKEKVRQLQETQLSVATKLGEAELKVATLQSAMDTTQSELFDLKAKYDEQAAAKSDEMEIIMTDLERANQRVTSSEKEIESLKSQLQSTSETLRQAEQMQKAPNMEQAIDILTRSSLEVELSAKEKEVSQLVDDVQRLQAANTKLRDSSSTQIAKLEEQISQKALALKNLEGKIQNQNDYEEMKRELTIMKSMEFQLPEDDTSNQQKSLEMLLLEKNRVLQSENTSMKLANAEMSSGGTSSQSQPRKFTNNYQLSQNFTGKDTSRTDTKSSDSHCVSQPSSPRPPVQPLPATASPMGTALVTRAIAYPALKQCYLDSGTINTIEVARIIKDLLLTYNIGQRVFGEYVLAMSQGSVSEILARPKLWDKLTVKGREPFIKMVDFLADEENMQTLLIINAKKKGKELSISTPPKPPMPSTSNPPPMPQDSTEAAINDILSQARKEMEAMSTTSISTKYQSIANHSNFTSNRRASPDRIRPLRHSAFKPYSETVVDRHVSDLLLEQEPQTEAIPLIKKVSKASSVEREAETHCQQDNAALVQRAIQQAVQESNCVVDNQLFMMSPSLLAMTKPLKRVLPPLTSQHYDKYPELNTRHVTTHVKERLNKYLIPQRLFGDHVLGLSQGSVSDILSHPKPWKKLTQKGREPFIRMQLWLEDDKAIEKLKSIYGKRGDIPDENCQDAMNSVRNTPPSTSSTSSSQSQLPLPTNKPLFEYDNENSSVSSMGSTDRNQQIQEQLATLPNLDTYEVTKQVKKRLYESNIGQRMFGEIVLGLTQGSVSDLLSKPKPWQSLSLKGKEPFLRMQAWLNDPDGIEKLKCIKIERRASHKRRSSLSTLTTENFEMSQVLSSNGFSPMKKPRTLLTSHEKDALLLAYSQEPYPSQTSIDFLAAELNLLPSTVTNWFHNHRSRSKRGHLAEQQSRLHQDVNASPVDCSGYQGSGSSTPTSFSQLSERAINLCPKKNNSQRSHSGSRHSGGVDEFDGMEAQLQKSGVVVVKPEPVDDDESMCQYSKEHWYVGGETGRQDGEDNAERIGSNETLIKRRLKEENSASWDY